MRREQNTYGMLAILMVIFLAGGLLGMEYWINANLVGLLGFCLVCSAGLLYCLMKLNVMEFQPGSVWDRLNQRIQQTSCVSKATKDSSKKQMACAQQKQVLFSRRYQKPNWRKAA